MLGDMDGYVIFSQVNGDAGRTVLEQNTTSREVLR